MSLRKLMHLDFVLILGEWDTKRGASILARTTASWTVVRCGACTPLYYVLPCKDALRRLSFSTAANVRAALDLDEDSAAPTVDIDAPAPPANAKSIVVIDNDGIVGILAAGGIQIGGGLKALAQDAGARTVPMVPLSHLPFEKEGTPLLVARKLEAELPASIVVGQEVSLLVSLTAADFAGPAESAFDLPIGTTVVIIVRAGGGLQIVGSDQQNLEVTEPQSDLPVRFAVKAVQLGAGTIRVLAFHGGAPLRSIMMATAIVEGDKILAGERTVERTNVELSAHPPQADLNLNVLLDKQTLLLSLQSADGQYTMNRYGPVEIELSPEQYFRSFFQDIERLSGDTPDKREVVRRKIETKGADLFNKLFPRDLRECLSKLWDRIQTVWILSDEAWIPWELCNVSGGVNRSADSFFLSQRFCVTRWFPGTPARSRLSLRDIALIVPPDTKLPNAPREKEFVLRLKGKGRNVTELQPTFVGVTDAMKKGSYDAWHFTGHASASPVADADRTFLELDDDKLVPENVTGHFANMLWPRPFIFLNACQSGRGGLSLTGLGGWAKRFVSEFEEGASVFIGSYWQVFDEPAFKFAENLYGFLLAGQPIGAAVRNARAAIRGIDDLTWLAYSVYAHPNAKVTEDA